MPRAHDARRVHQSCHYFGPLYRGPTAVHRSSYNTLGCDRLGLIAVPLWGQPTQNLSGVPPERDYNPKRDEVKVDKTAQVAFRVPILGGSQTTFLRVVRPAGDLGSALGALKKTKGHNCCIYFCIYTSLYVADLHHLNHLYQLHVFKQ